MSGTRVRPATPGDAAAVAAIINHLVRETTVTFTSIDKTADDIAPAIAAAGAGYVVAEARGAVVGYATYGPFRPGPGYARTAEHSIALAPGAWGAGTGRALMTAIENHARSTGIQSFIAGISGENTAGLAFHAAIGFDRVGHLPRVGFKFDRWLDLVLMQKFL